MFAIVSCNKLASFESSGGGLKKCFKGKTMCFGYIQCPLIILIKLAAQFL